MPTQIPHLRAKDLPASSHHLETMQNFVDVLEYLANRRWGENEGAIAAPSGIKFLPKPMPLILNNACAVQRLAACEQGDFAMEGPEFRAAVLKDGTRPEEVQIDMDKFNKVWPRLTVIGSAGMCSFRALTAAV